MDRSTYNSDLCNLITSQCQSLQLFPGDYPRGIPTLQKKETTTVLRVSAHSYLWL